MAASSRSDTLELQPLPSLAPSFTTTKGDNAAVESLDQHSQTVLRSTTRSSQVADHGVTPPTDDDTISPEHKRNDRIQFLALCWLVFLVGWNDGTTGPLIPRMQVDYKLDYLIVSLLFVATAIVSSVFFCCWEGI
jgi:hypothetical protein